MSQHGYGIAAGSLHGNNSPDQGVIHLINKCITVTHVIESCTCAAAIAGSANAVVSESNALQQRSNQPLCPHPLSASSPPSSPLLAASSPCYPTYQSYKGSTVRDLCRYPYLFSHIMQVWAHSLVLTLLPCLQEAVPAPGFRRLTDSTRPCQHWQCWGVLLLGCGGPCSADSGHLFSLCHPAWLLACQCFSDQSAYSGIPPLHSGFLPPCNAPRCHLPVCLFICCLLRWQ